MLIEKIKTPIALLLGGILSCLCLGGFASCLDAFGTGFYSLTVRKLHPLEVGEEPDFGCAHRVGASYRGKISFAADCALAHYCSP
jgi:hypothetical protein